MSGIRLHDCTPSIEVADDLSLDECIFDHVDLKGLALEELTARDVVFSASDFANATLRKTYFERVEFSSCRLLGLSAPDCRAKDVVLTECNCQFAHFRFSTFQSVVFDHCDLQDADFQGSDLRGVRFSFCDLRRAQLSAAKLGGADMRGSDLTGIQMNPQDVRGAIIDPIQAADLVPLLGVRYS
jgi:uncharacterized protein YjbI with pentapeptide repeats